MKTLPPLSGVGADFGCGIGWLARGVLASPKVTKLTLVDLDRRAIDAACRNIEDPRAAFVWEDARLAATSLDKLDFVVTNPPFHETGGEDRSLGQAFIKDGRRQPAQGRRPVAGGQSPPSLRGDPERAFRQGAAGRRDQRLQGLRGPQVTKALMARLDRLLANLGYGSRKDVQALIASGKVVLDGKIS